MSAPRITLPAYAYEVFPGDLLDGHEVLAVTSTGRAQQDTATISCAGQDDRTMPAMTICDVERRLDDVVEAAPATSDPDVVQQIVDLARTDT